MKISDKQLKEVCKIGAGRSTCRYITCGVNGFECEKHGELGPILNSRANSNKMVAQGDNCSGAEADLVTD